MATSAPETKQDLKRILVVDDEPNINDLISTSLKFSGFDVRSAMNGAEALTIAEEFKPHALVLDVMMPGMSGFQVCEKLRKDGLKVGVLFLTAKDSTDDKVTGLTIGGDDYMVKPFRHPSELIARIRTRLRRTNADVSGLLTIGDLAIDVQAHQVLRAGKQIQLTRLEFDLLVALAKEPGRVFTRDALLSEVWGYRHSTDTRLVNVHVQRLRSKIEHDAEHPEIVITIRGVGYKAGVMGGS